MISAKTLLLPLCLFASTAALAQTPPASATGRDHAAQFEQHKQRELQGIQARMQILQTLQSCVQAATNRQAIHSCNETAKQQHQALKGQKR